MEFLKEVSLLSIVVWAPALFALLLFLIPYNKDEQSQIDSSLRYIALGGSVLVFGLSMVIAYQLLGSESTGLVNQLAEKYSWFSSSWIEVNYQLAIDGVSLVLICLTTFLFPIIVLGSVSINRGLRGYLISMLVLETCIIGSLLAVDMFLFYFFWEAMLIPMYFIIGIWGGTNRRYATVKFVLYTVFGSVFMGLAILLLSLLVYRQTGVFKFDLVSFQSISSISSSLSSMLLLFFMFGLGVKVPIWPLHTWLPDAHTEAPTGGSIILAGILLKLGLYGVFRFVLPILPGTNEYLVLFMALGVIGIIYGALVAMVQLDIKRLVAYSSVSHLGYCVLGIFSNTVEGISGSILQMINHGISTSALFVLVGVLYDRIHSRQISDYGGLAKVAPVYALLFVFFTMSSIALPLTNGFVGEFMILRGAFVANSSLAAVAVLGVVLGAVYMLSLCKGILFGEVNPKITEIKDINLREAVMLAPLVIMVFVLGLHPNLVLSVIDAAVRSIIFT